MNRKKMDDLISRKETLKNIEKIRWSTQMMDDTHRADLIMRGIHLCEEAVMYQPSAEPEIIRCKDCKQFRRWVDTDTCFCDITEFKMSDNDFCSRAERRPDG